MEVEEGGRSDQQTGFEFEFQRIPGPEYRMSPAPDKLYFLAPPTSVTAATFVANYHLLADSGASCILGVLAGLGALQMSPSAV
jgi:hypothetical protein